MDFFIVTKEFDNGIERTKRCECISKSIEIAEAYLFSIKNRSGFDIKKTTLKNIVNDQIFIGDQYLVKSDTHRFYDLFDNYSTAEKILGEKCLIYPRNINTIT